MLVIVVTLYPKNLLSATTYPKAVDEKLAKEIQLRRIVGPFDRQSFPVFHVSPLGTNKLPVLLLFIGVVICDNAAS